MSHFFCPLVEGICDLCKVFVKYPPVRNSLTRDRCVGVKNHPAGLLMRTAADAAFARFKL